MSYYTASGFILGAVFMQLLNANDNVIEIDESLSERAKNGSLTTRDVCGLLDGEEGIVQQLNEKFAQMASDKPDVPRVQFTLPCENAVEVTQVEAVTLESN